MATLSINDRLWCAERTLLILHALAAHAEITRRSTKGTNKIGLQFISVNAATSCRDPTCVAAFMQLIFVWMVELTAKQHEKRIILIVLRLKGAENRVPDPQITDASAPDL
jgi:hypothetical protein